MAASHRLRERLLGPHVRLTDTEDRLGARLVGALALVQSAVVAALVVSLEIVWRTTFHGSFVTAPGVWIVCAGAVGIGVAYGVIRAGYYRPGAALYILVSLAVSLSVPFLAPTRGEIAMVASALISILVTATVFSERTVAAVLAVAVAGALVGLALAQLPARTTKTGIALTSVVLVMGVLFILVRRHQTAVAQARSAVLIAAERKYREIFEAVTDGVLVAELGGRIVEANEACCRAFGYTRDELLSMSVYQAVLLDEPERSRLRARVVERGTASVEVTGKRKDGTTFPVELAITVIEREGRPLFIGVGRDVTLRKRMEDEQRRLEVALQHAAKLESIGLLAGGVAHDFNNYLTAILGNIELAEPHPDRQGVLRDARDAAMSAAALTRQLLAFSRRQVIQPRVIDLNEGLRNLQRMLGRLIGEDIVIETRLAADLHPVKLDPVVLEQIVVNLVVNARDAMPRGGTVLISTENAAAPAGQAGEYVLLAIRDDGHGMTPEVRSRLFEPFFTTKAKGRGTGLGLATTYGAVRQSDGFIEVLSEPGRGTTFQLYFPRAAPPGERAEATAEPPAKGGHETLLVVEDDPAIRKLAVTLLEQAGYRVLSAESGEQALEQAAPVGHPIDLLVTDVVLPGIDGGRLAERLRELHPETRVLYTSGYMDESISRRGIPGETDLLLPKPYTAQALARAVRRKLDER